MKKFIVSIITIVGILVGGFEYQQDFAKGSKGVYYTAHGSYYHKDKDCKALKNATKIYNESLKQAKKEGLDACSICVHKTSSSTVAASKNADINVKILNNNKATFTSKDKKRKSFEEYGELDALGRCTTAFVLAGPETLPAEKRGSIGMVRPTGWQTKRYAIVGEGSSGYLYNRCHLIAYEISGENANKLNLITGTRYMNINEMLPYENKIASYIKKTGHHVLYRVTPDFKKNELVARGVAMEAKSIEDNEIEFNIYAYNRQPGITIDYATGKSKLTK